MPVMRARRSAIRRSPPGRSASRRRACRRAFVPAGSRLPSRSLPGSGSDLRTGRESRRVEAGPDQARPRPGNGPARRGVDDERHRHRSSRCDVVEVALDRRLEHQPIGAAHVSHVEDVPRGVEIADAERTASCQLELGDLPRPRPDREAVVAARALMLESPRDRDVEIRLACLDAGELGCRLRAP